MKRIVPLEPAAEAVCNASSIPPLIFQLPPEQGRKVLDDLQDAPVCSGFGINAPLLNAAEPR